MTFSGALHSPIYIVARRAPLPDLALGHLNQVLLPPRALVAIRAPARRRPVGRGSLHRRPRGHGVVPAEEARQRRGDPEASVDGKDGLYALHGGEDGDVGQRELDATEVGSLIEALKVGVDDFEEGQEVGGEGVAANRGGVGKEAVEEGGQLGVSLDELRERR